MQDYYKSGRMLVKLAEAIGRLALAGRELTRLAGFTARVNEIQEILKDLSHGKYERTMLDSGGSRPALIPGAGEIVPCDNLIR